VLFTLNLDNLDSLSINLTNVAFEKRETNLLEKGLKYALPPSNTGSATDLLIADLTVALEREIHAPHTQILTIIKSNPVDQIPAQLTSVLKSTTSKRKIKYNNLFVSKADKGNSVVVMKRSDYNTKVKVFIDTSGGKRITFNFDKFCRTVRKSICYRPALQEIPSVYEPLFPSSLWSSKSP